MDCAKQRDPTPPLTRGFAALTGLLLLLLRADALAAAAVIDQAVQVTAQVQTHPPQISLSWPAATGALSFEVFRKSPDASSWGTAVTNLPGTATNHIDTHVVLGAAYEYRVKKSDLVYGGEGYLLAGMEVPMTETRGKLLLLVDATVAAALEIELRQLLQDLVGDGWIVIRRDVSRTAPVAEVKALIQAEYQADPSQVKSIFLFGHVPVPYSGDAYPDGHTEHRGAWPADGFYADMNGTWTDSSVNRATATDPRNRNVAGDGKYDQTLLPSDLELQVGRVDFANLPAFAKSEVELLRQYLVKNHKFRHGRLAVQRRGLIDDNFGVGVGEAYAVSGWRNIAAFFSASNTFAADWLGTLQSGSYLWGYGCGPGTYTSVGGVVSTTDLTTSDPRVVFTMFHGSYHGDWDATNNVMRAALATPGYTLTSVWSGRPHWQFHQMGLGEPIGFSARLVQNNNGSLYQIPGFGRFIHIALLGDPTLRLHPVTPPSALVVSTNQLGSAELQWIASPDAVAGYVVYRASTAAGPFVRLHADFVTTTSFTDNAPTTPAVYQVRAVKLETSPGGTYFNPSQGIFEDTSGSFGSPRLGIRPANGKGTVQVEWPVNAVGFRLETQTIDPPSAWGESSSLATNGGAQYQAEVAPQGMGRYFRLAKP